MNCKNNEKDPVVVYVSKMVLVKQRKILGLTIKPNYTDTIFYGFARIFSGKISSGKELYVITPSSN